jgi:hypothetical protein
MSKAQFFKRGPTGRLAERISAQLTGRELDSIVRREYDWVFCFGKEATLSTPGPWRIIADGQVVLAGQDDGHPFGLPEPVDAVALAKRYLDGKPIAAVLVREDTGDLTIGFHGGSLIEVLNTSMGYEGWAYAGPKFEVVAQGGGSLAYYEG